MLFANHSNQTFKRTSILVTEATTDALLTVISLSWLLGLIEYRLILAVRIMVGGYFCCLLRTRSVSFVLKGCARAGLRFAWSFDCSLVQSCRTRLMGCCSNST
jgi:hypothetical protein